MYPTMEDVHYAHPAPTTARPVTTGIPVNPTQTSTYYARTVQETFQVQEAQAPGPWSTGLCDCCGDVKNCCITCFCPCITFGQIAEIVDKGSTSCGASGALYTLIFCVTGCQCIYSCFYRSKMRQQYRLQKRPCNDCLVHCCCECCALCQEYRELKRRGFDMHIGWHANMEKRGGGATIPPVVQQSMTRFEIPVEDDAESDNTFRRQF